MTNEVRFLGDMEKLTVSPNDVFVIRIEDQVSSETANRISAEVSAALAVVAGGKPRVLVLSGGMAIGVVDMSAKVAA